MSTCRCSRTRRSIRQRDERAEELAQILLHTTRDLTLPIGLRITSTEPHVIVHWSDWVERGGLRLFTRAVFRQAEEVFNYSFDRLEIGPLPDSLFEAPAQPTRRSNFQ